ncbi:thymus-specific serine protease [Heteronotia binoei]|uniref:thymus-specific serine protease n=1 Tax=Heteronotia binoei TaxID=13085 RepID=UPI00292CE4D7|nr:thymus-specific serine protease [Heteronotia binoei]
MGALKLSFGACLLLLLSVAQAGRHFQLYRQYVLQQREERAMKDASLHSDLLPRRPVLGSWHRLIESTLRQPLDHFNRQNPATFNQRFWINAKYWRRPDGPVFLFIGGEGSLSKYDVLSGHHVELARKLGALLLALEHRFYGASINPDGLQGQNLMFLSSQQALADLASFHMFITQKLHLTQNNTWIGFGGSYPGALAAWFRLKFPHLVFAAVASSAPVRAQMDFTGYNKVVAESLSNPVIGGSKECRDGVAEAFSSVDSLIQTGQLEKLAKDFRSCEPLSGSANISNFVSGLADIFMSLVQYNGELGSVEKLCRIMTNRTVSPYQRLVALNDNFLDGMTVGCVNNCYKCSMEELRNTTVNMWGVGERQWVFQQCTEFGYFQTCEDSSCIFSRLIDLQYMADVCVEVFNIAQDRIQEGVGFTNEYYGADHPKASRVLFVNGDIDPWHSLSILKNQSSSELALVINGTAHCADMLPSSFTDPLPLVQARKFIDAQVSEWLELAQKMTGDL